jgi:hypothetical protein
VFWELYGVEQKSAGAPGGPGNSANDRTVAKERTLTLLTKIREARVVDLGPQGPSHGDMRVVNAPLYDANEMTECMYTYTLPDGEISAEGVSIRPSLFEHPPSNADALSGGTEKYAGVRGEVRFVTRGNKVISTFHFIG